ncbi:hypothetical protein SALBM311S_10020 [Streptomyces alboniger]
MHVDIPRRRATARVATAVAATAGLLVPLAESGHAAPVPTVPAAHAPSGIKTVSSGLTIPWGVAWLPDGSALVNERDSLKVFRTTASGKRTEVTASPQIAAPNSGQSLLGIAVSPNWAKDHHVFIYHGAKEGNRIARLTFDGSKLTGYKTLVKGIKRGLHNGGRIKFGPDGYLYATTGDADNKDSAQNKKSLNGKVLRMTKEEACAGQPLRHPRLLLRPPQPARSHLGHAGAPVGDRRSATPRTTNSTSSSPARTTAGPPVRAPAPPQA